MDFKSSDTTLWKKSLSSYETLIKSLNNKPNLVTLDDFYRNKLPLLLHERDPNPYITTQELSQLLQWKIARGKWRPRLLSFVSSLTDDVVKAASNKAFLSLPDLSNAVEQLKVLKGVGPATASAVLAAYAPDVAPFMSDEAVEAAIGGDSRDYSLKRYLAFAERIQGKSKELSTEDEVFTPSDVERALWCSVMADKLESTSGKTDEVGKNKAKRKRK